MKAIHRKRTLMALIKALESDAIPQLRLLGFRKVAQAAPTHMSWTFQRKPSVRSPTSMDVIDISFSGIRSNSIGFVGIINLIDSESKDKLVEAGFSEENIGATCLGKRIIIEDNVQKKWRPFWFWNKSDLRAFELPEFPDDKDLTCAAEALVSRFVNLLPQAEQYFINGTLGTNLRCHQAPGFKFMKN